MKTCLLKFALAMFLAPLLPASAQSIVTNRNLTYAGFIDLNGRPQSLVLDLYRPAAVTGTLPVLIWVHGGGWTTGSHFPLPDNLISAVGEGYAIAALELPPSAEAKWPAQIQACKAGVRWLRAQAAAYNLDPNQFVAWGTSSGGHLVSMLSVSGGVPATQVGGARADFVGTGTNAPFAEFSDRVRAVCGWSSPTDFLRMNNAPNGATHDLNSPESNLIAAALQTSPELASTTNPALLASEDDAEMLLVHGVGDGSVPFNQSEILHAAMVRAGGRSTLLPIVPGNHGLGMNTPANFLLTLRFFDQVLGRSNAPALAAPGFSMSPTSGVAPVLVSFNAGAYAATNPALAGLTWSYGNNRGASGTNVTHSFTNPGTYLITLAARGTNSAVRSTSRVLIVQPAPTANTNAPPVTLAASATPDGNWFAPAGVFLNAVSSFGDAALRQVEFLCDGVPLGLDTVAPFNLGTGVTAPGPHVFTAQALTTNGVTVTTPPLTLLVRDPNDPQPRASLPGGKLAMTYWENLAALGRTHDAAVSPELSAWSTNGLTRAALATNGAVRAVRVTDAVPSSNALSRFLRLLISNP